MTERIKTTLRLPEKLHKRFDAGTMNADIVARLENSFRDEWRGLAMSANGLMDYVDLPDVLRIKSSGNAHEDMGAICELLSGLPVESVLLGLSKTKRLVVAMQLDKITLVADQCAFVLDSTGRAEDMHNLIVCLDAQDLLTDCQCGLKPVLLGDSPNQSLDAVFNQTKKAGMQGIRSLCELLNPSYTIDI